MRTYPRLLSELNIASGTQLDLREFCSSTVLDCKVYFGDSYRDYEDALKRLGLMISEERREQKCLKFAKQCLQLDEMRQFFSRNKNGHVMSIRSSEFFEVSKCQAARYKRSAIPSMIRLLKECERRLQAKC